MAIERAWIAAAADLSWMAGDVTEACRFGSLNHHSSHRSGTNSCADTTAFLSFTRHRCSAHRWVKTASVRIDAAGHWPLPASEYHWLCNALRLIRYGSTSLAQPLLFAVARRQPD